MIQTLKGAIAIGVLLVLCVPLVVTNDMLFPYITGKNFAFRIIVEVVAVLWVVVCLYDKAYRPRSSLILWAFVAFVGVMLAATINSVDVVRSFWSNFERMEGWVSSAHLFVYFLVAASVFRTKTVVLFERSYSFIVLFLGVSVAVATCVGCLAIVDKFDATKVTTDWRLTGTTGNAAYMALYMLFATASAIALAFYTRVSWQRYLLSVLAAFFVFLLVQTATRGVVIGLAVSVIATTGYLLVFWRGAAKIRRSVALLFSAALMLVVLVGVFRDAPIIEQNRILQRATNINLSELTVRMTVWDVAIQGVKEKPVLGWGQDNFAYVFTKYYEPSLANQEPWFDRAHNVFLDWLVAGGVLGLVTYLMLFATTAWYVVVRPRFGDKSFSIGEQAALFGISAGYFVQNLVVFDTLISYVYFGAILAFVHARVGKESIFDRLPVLKNNETLTTVVAPIAVICVCLVVYVVNIPAMRAASGIIDGIRTGTLEEKTEIISKTFFYTPMAQTEVLRTSLDSLRSVMVNPNVTASAKQKFVDELDVLVTSLAARRPLTAFEAVLLSEFYLNFDPVTADKYARYAYERGPRKVDLVINYGLTSFLKEDIKKATELWNTAYDLYPQGRNAQAAKANAMVLEGREDEVFDFFDDTADRGIVQNQFVLSVAQKQEADQLLYQIYQRRVAAGSMLEYDYVMLAVLAYQFGYAEEAIAVMEEATVRFPEYTASFSCAVSNVNSNLPIDQACE